jgi:leader peptidase (prepilin peptidase)/N-methyltransferase
MTFAWPSALVAGVFGSLVGSFLNVCISRWPAEQSVLSPPRSRCPRCGRMIRWYENIPIASWLALRARCAGCRQPISVQYPLVELAAALIWAAAFLPADFSWLTSFRLAVFATVMLGVSVTDARHYVIPDGFTLFGLFFVLATTMVATLRGDTAFFAGPWQAFLGACVGAGAISIAGWLGEVAFKKEAMGFGDATLMAVCGAALGPELALVNVFVAALLGAVGFLLFVGPIAWWRARRAGREFEMPLVPFGVFLAPAAVVTLLWGTRITAWYMSALVPA